MMDLALPLLHPPLPYRGVEWWWSKVIGSEVVSEEGGAALEQISPEPEVEPSRESGLANRTPSYRSQRTACNEASPPTYASHIGNLKTERNSDG
jgi:hypothetical protein